MEFLSDLHKERSLVRFFLQNKFSKTKKLSKIVHSDEASLDPINSPSAILEIIFLFKRMFFSSLIISSTHADELVQIEVWDMLLEFVEAI